MPMNPKDYPPEWKAIAYLKKDLAQWKCEECRRPCRKPGETQAAFINRVPRRWHDDLFEGDECEISLRLGRFVLGVAHLDHNPANSAQKNLRALCAPCHRRYDLSQMGRKKILKRERLGQLRLPV